MAQVGLAAGLSKPNSTQLPNPEALHATHFTVSKLAALLVYTSDSSRLWLDYAPN
jgi:hypothetical protein